MGGSGKMTSQALEDILAKVRLKKERNKPDWLDPVIKRYQQQKNIKYKYAQESVFNEFIDAYSRMRETGDGRQRSVAKALYITGAKHVD